LCAARERRRAAGSGAPATGGGRRVCRGGDHGEDRALRAARALGLPARAHRVGARAWQTDPADVVSRSRRRPLHLGRRRAGVPAAPRARGAHRRRRRVRTGRRHDRRNVRRRGAVERVAPGLGGVLRRHRTAPRRRRVPSRLRRADGGPGPVRARSADDGAHGLGRDAGDAGCGCGRIPTDPRMSASGPSASVIERAGLVLSGMGVLSLFTVRSYIENVPSTAPDITYGVAAFLALTILATLRRAPSWAPLVALIAVSFGYLYANAILDGTELGTVLLVVTLVLGYRIAPKEWRALVVGGLSLWTPALTLYSGARPLRVEPPVAAAAVVALGLFVFVLFRYRSENEDRLRRVGLGLVAIAVTSAVFERHNVVSSSILAPDDIAAILAVAVLAVVG